MTSAPTTAQATGLTVPIPTIDSKEDKEKERQLRTLVSALRKHSDTLPEDVQQLVKEVSSKSGQEETKLLHAAVSQHGRAKKELQEAQTARHQMHSAWRNFLSQSVDQWNAYTQKFMDQEKQLTDRVVLAKEQLAQAKLHLTSCQNSAGGTNSTDLLEVSDAEEMDTRETETSAGKRIADSLQELNANLTTLHNQAVQAVEKEAEEQDKKRPRIAEKDTKEAPESAPANAPL